MQIDNKYILNFTIDKEDTPQYLKVKDRLQSEYKPPIEKNSNLFNITPLTELYGFIVKTSSNERYEGRIVRVVQLVKGNLVIEIRGDIIELKQIYKYKDTIQVTQVAKWKAWEVKPNVIYSTIREVSDKVNKPN